jgi:hypothetical protein
MGDINMNKDTSVIPIGSYCYTPIEVEGDHYKIKICPYWSRDNEKEEQMNGCCSFLGISDHENGTLLWDQIKECGVNEGDEENE